MKPDLLRLLFLGFVRIHILHHADEEPIFGVGIMEELAHHGYKLSPGTLYPLLRDLERRGLLVCTGETVEGRVRNYYRITAAGREALGEARAQIAELVEEVVEHREHSGHRHGGASMPVTRASAAAARGRAKPRRVR